MPWDLINNHVRLPTWKYKIQLNDDGVYLHSEFTDNVLLQANDTIANVILQTLQK